MTITDLGTQEYDSYYKRYIDKLSSHLDLREAFEIGRENIIAFFQSIPRSKHNYQYENDKWTVKEILQHLIDTERVFMYRCFRIARRDKTPLAGFDQDIYIKPSGAKDKQIDELLEEYTICRQNSVSVLASISDHDLQFIGNANGGDMSARAAAFTIIGHEIWHMDIIKERYL
ncbi:DinB family protein [Aquimarina sp. 433]